ADEPKLFKTELANSFASVLSVSSLTIIFIVKSSLNIDIVKSSIIGYFSLFLYSNIISLIIAANSVLSSFLKFSVLFTSLLIVSFVFVSLFLFFDMSLLLLQEVTNNIITTTKNIPLISFGMVNFTNFFFIIILSLFVKYIFSFFIYI